MRCLELSSRARVLIPHDRLQYHVDALTVRPALSSVALEGDPEPPPVELLAMEEETAEGTVCTVPRFYALAECSDPPPSEALQCGDPLAPGVAFSGTLSERTSQRSVHDTILKAWRSTDPRDHGSLAVLPCGFGKTVLALACAAHWGRCALIVVPNSVLADQWRDRATAFLPQAAVTSLRGGVWNIADREWYLGGVTEADVARGLSLRERAVSYAARDKPRRVRVRCEQLLGVTGPGDAVEWDGADTAFTLRPGGAVKLRLRERVKPPYVALAPAPGGVRVSYARAVKAATWPPALRSAAVPGALFPARLRVGLAPEAGRYPDVVITTAQTLSMHAPPPCATEACGLLVADEVHSLCARVFSTALSAVPCARLLALSATPERPDNLHVVLPLLAGREVARVDRAWQRVDVRRVVYRNGDQRELKLPNGRLMLAQMLSRLAADGRRTAAIAALVRDLVREGRHVLLLTERVEHVAALAEAIGSATGAECGQMHGGTPAAERARAAERAVIVATYPLCRQGFDVPRLDTLVMATPVTAIEQPVGRILRVHPDKCDPLVIDVVDPFSIFAGEGRKRWRFYDDNGYEVTEEDLPAV